MYSSTIWGGIQSHLWKQVMLFKPRTVDETFVQAKYLENIGYKKGQQSGYKKKDHKDASKEGKKWKGKEKKKKQNDTLV